MKTNFLRATALILSVLFILSAFAGCAKTGKQGPTGSQGETSLDGKSAYELAVANGYTGTVEEWLVSLVGTKGETGAQGTGIAGAHIDENMHLILELTDGSEIDAGYVGVTTEDVEPEIYMTRAEWINTLVDALEYEEVDIPDTPSFSDIMDNEYQQAIEQAVKYNLLDLSNESFLPDDAATREFAIVTAIKGMGYIPGDNIECDDFDDILYPEYAQLALDLGLIELKNGKFQPNKLLVESEKEKIFNVLEETLCSMNGPDGDEEGFVYNESVVSLSSFTGFSVADTNSLIQYTEDGKLKLPRMPELENLTVNQIIAIDNRHAFKVVSSTIEDEWILIEYTKPEIYEVLDQLDIAGTAYPDVEQFQPAEGVTVISNPIQTYISGGDQIDIPNIPLFVELEIPLADNYSIKIKLDWSVVSAEYKYDIDFRWLVPDVNNAYIVFDNNIDINLALSKSSGGALTLDGITYPTKWVLGVLPFIGTDNFGIVAQVSLVLTAEGTFEFAFEVVGTTGAQIINNLPRQISTWDVNFNEIGLAGEMKAGAKVEVLAEIFDWDLISFAVDFGVSAKGETKVRSGPTICFDCSFAPYLEFTLFEDCVIDNWLNCAIKVAVLENNSDNPWQETGIHIEDLFNVVEECTYTEKGTVVGIVVNAENPYEMIQDAKIEVYDYITGLLVKEPAFSDFTGEYSINTDDGTYRIRVSAEGYIPFETVQEVREGETVYVEALLMVEGSENSNELSFNAGTITDAVTGYPIDGVNLTIRKGWNKTSGEKYGSLVTDENGRYEITLPLGNYTVYMEKEGYIGDHFNIAVTKTTNLNLGGSIVPTGESEIATGNLTIVLNWGETPDDLDSHLFGPTSDGENIYHIYYWDESYYENGEVIANLDVDDTTSYGPETITVYSMNDTGKYSYFVHDYSNRGNENSTAMAASGAYVKVYIGEKLVATYYVPAMKTGTTWHVFDYDAEQGKITAVNSVSSGYPEYSVSGISTFGNFDVQLPEKTE